MDADDGKVGDEGVEAEGEERGLSCPDCGCRHLPVRKTRDGPGARKTRIRYCRNCGRKVLTRERVG